VCQPAGVGTPEWAELRTEPPPASDTVSPINAPESTASNYELSTNRVDKVFVVVVIVVVVVAICWLVGCTRCTRHLGTSSNKQVERPGRTWNFELERSFRPAKAATAVVTVTSVGDVESVGG
jgi:hypothetical protein